MAVTRFARLRALDPLVVDGAVAVLLAVGGVASVFAAKIEPGSRFEEPNALVVVATLLACAPIVVRRRWPVPALAVTSAGVLLHLLAGFPAGVVPLAALLLTYSVGAYCAIRPALVGLAILSATIIVLAVADPPGLDTAGAFGVLVQYTAVWAIGVAMRQRRVASEAAVREADERAEAERQTAARVLAEQRLLIAQELHDVVAHSMSVIAVQAGVGAHVVDERPADAKKALEAISTTSRDTLTELRRLLGVLRDAEGARTHQPAPQLSDVPHLVEEVRAAGVPVTLTMEGTPSSVHSGVELSAYRVVQEALTNVIKHAGKPTRVDVSIRYGSGTVTVEVVDDGRGLAALPDEQIPGSGHGVIGMRERVDVWGGELSVGPAPGGGYRVCAVLPYGESE